MTAEYAAWLAALQAGDEVFVGDAIRVVTGRTASGMIDVERWRFNVVLTAGDGTTELWFVQERVGT